jgi:hypothetical protein
MNEEINVSWMNEMVEKIPGKQGFYKLLCVIFLKRRLTYNNLYVLSYAYHKKQFKNKEEELKIKILIDLAKIYYFNNNKLPNGFDFK